MENKLITKFHTLFVVKKYYQQAGHYKVKVCKFVRKRLCKLTRGLKMKAWCLIY